MHLRASKTSRNFLRAPARACACVRAGTQTQVRASRMRTRPRAERPHEGRFLELPMNQPFQSSQISVATAVTLAALRWRASLHHLSACRTLFYLSLVVGASRRSAAPGSQSIGAAAVTFWRGMHLWAAKRLPQLVGHTLLAGKLSDNVASKVGCACNTAQTRPEAQRPNPSFKRTPNSVSRQSASAGPAAHFALAARHATLPGSA